MEDDDDNRELDWDKLANIAIPIINRAPGVTVLLGTFKPTSEEVSMIEKRKKSVPKKKDPISQKQTAENVRLNDIIVYCSQAQISS